MRGAVSPGLCLVLEAAGLVGAFDRIYGVSAGALNGWATAGQAGVSATHYEDAAHRRVFNRMRPLLGRPVIDFDLLFEEVIVARKPLSFERLVSGRELRVLATSLESLTLRVLGDFADGSELRRAVRASASLPRLGGPPPVFPEGATHVLVLRSRPASYRKPVLTALSERLAFGDDPRRLEPRRAEPVRRLAMVLRPEREMRATLELVRAWAADSDVMLAGLEDDPRLPADCDRRSAEALAAGCDAVLALGGDGTMPAALPLGALHDTPALGINLGTLGYLARSTPPTCTPLWTR
jgi:hypothetical protein